PWGDLGGADRRGIQGSAGKAADPGRLRSGDGRARLRRTGVGRRYPAGDAPLPQSGRARPRRARIDLSIRLGGRSTALAIGHRGLSRNSHAGLLSRRALRRASWRPPNPPDTIDSLDQTVNDGTPETASRAGKDGLRGFQPTSQAA